MPLHRRRSALSLSASLAALVAVSLPTSRAAACSVACAAGTILPSGGDIPSDQVRFRFEPLSGKGVKQIDGGTSLPRLYRLEGPARVEVPVRVESSSSEAVWFAPEAPLPVGTQLVLEAPSCRDAPLRGEYTITASAPIPGELGTLQATLHRDALRVAVISGACSLPADISYADLSVKLAESARPYAAVFDYKVFVDGREHPEFSTSFAAPSTLPQGEARIYATCRADTYFRSEAALTEGLHRVRMTAKIADKELETPEIELDLSCKGAMPAWEPDSDLGDLRPPRANDAGGGGEIVDAGTGTSPGEIRRSGTEDSGCALYADDAAQRTIPAWFALVGIALTLRGRRRNDRRGGSLGQR